MSDARAQREELPQFPPCQGRSFPGFPSFPGKGRELPPPLPHIPAAEPGDCDELWVRGASAGFLAPAGRPGAIARLLPARPRSLPAVPLGRRRGHRAVTLARPRSPQPSPAAGSRASGDAGREERGQVGGTAGDSGEGTGTGVPGCQARSPLAEGPGERGRALWARRARGMHGNPGDVPAPGVPAGCPSGETRLLLAASCQGQLLPRGSSWAWPCPHVPPPERCPAQRETGEQRAGVGKGTGRPWASCGWGTLTAGAGGWGLQPPPQPLTGLGGRPRRSLVGR